MTHIKIKTFIKRLNQRMFETFEAYFIRKHLYLSQDINTHGNNGAQRNVSVINEYQNFYLQTRFSNLAFFIIGIAKFFDNPKSGNKPLSIQKVQSCVQGDRKNLTAQAFLAENIDRPYAKELAEQYAGITEENLKEIDQLLEKNNATIAIFKNLRDKRFAHDDIKKMEVRLPPFELIEELFSDIVAMINIFSYGLENSTTNYSHVENIVKNDIIEMFKNLHTMTTAQKIAQLQKGVTFLVDASGKRKAVQFDLANKEVSELLEDLFDGLIVAERQYEPRSGFAQVKKRILTKTSKNRTKS